MTTAIKMVHKSDAQMHRILTRDRKLVDKRKLEPIDINQAMLDMARQQGLIGYLTPEDVKSTNKHIR